MSEIVSRIGRAVEDHPVLARGGAALIAGAALAGCVGEQPDKGMPVVYDLFKTTIEVCDNGNDRVVTRWSEDGRPIGVVASTKRGTLELGRTYTVTAGDDAGVSPAGEVIVRRRSSEEWTIEGAKRGQEITIQGPEDCSGDFGPEIDEGATAEQFIAETAECTHDFGRAKNVAKTALTVVAEGPDELSATLEISADEPSVIQYLSFSLPGEVVEPDDDNPKGPVTSAIFKYKVTANDYGEPELLGTVNIGYGATDPTAIPDRRILGCGDTYAIVPLKGERS